MKSSDTEQNSMDARLAERLRALRQERGWSLDELAVRSGVSRATLSRLENAEVSPTAAVLGRLCTAHALTMSRLMAMVETEFAPLVPRAVQAVWRDGEAGFTRRSVSPPADTLAAEVLECTLDPGTLIDYPAPPRPGLEHHLVLLDGDLRVTIEDAEHTLRPGDCLRYQLFGRSVFAASGGRPVRYILVIV